MAIKFEKLKAGMTVYDNGFSLGPMGRRPASWEVLIESVDEKERTVVARWNVLNPPRTYPERIATKWSAKPRKAKP